MKKIIVVGHAMHDMFFTTMNNIAIDRINTTDLFEEVGGPMHNVIYNCGLLGMEGIFVSKKGNDDNAGLIEKQLRALGIETVGIPSFFPTPVFIHVLANDADLRLTSAQEVLNFKRGDIPDYDSLEGCEYGITDCVNPGFLLELIDELPDTRWIVTGTFPEEYITSHLEGCVMSRQELRSIIGGRSAEEVIKERIDQGLQWVIITNGTQDAILYTAKDTHTINWPHSEFHYTYGSQEAFLSGLLYGLANDCDLDRCIRLATQAGHLALQDRSAYTPTINQIKSLLGEE